LERTGEKSELKTKRDMKTRKLVGAVKGLVEEGLKTLAEPSERKMESAKRKVNELKKELKEAEEEAVAANQEWNKFKKEVAARIRQNENTIGRFRNKMEKSGAKFKAKYEEKVRELERKNNLMKVKLGAYKTENLARWNEFRTVAKKNMEEMKRNMAEIALSFKGLTDSVLMRSRR
jgi:hypothetical protein